MRRNAAGVVAPAVPPLPVQETASAKANITDAIAFTLTAAGSDSAQKWLDAYDRVVCIEAQRHASPPRVRIRNVMLNGESCLRTNFESQGGSPWVLYYSVVEDLTTGVPILLRVVGVLHGSSKGNPN